MSLTTLSVFANWISDRIYLPRYIRALVAELEARFVTIEADVAAVEAASAVRGVVTANVADLGAFTVAGNDGLTYTAGQRVLLAKQTTTTQDGIYVVGTVAVGAAPLTRASDWAAASVQPGASEIKVDEGTAFAKTTWYPSVGGNVTVGTTSPAFYPKRIKAVSAALAGTPGTLAITAQWIKSASASIVLLTRKNPAGTTGDLSYGTLTAGAGDGSFTITSTGNETSTIAYEIVNAE